MRDEAVAAASPDPAIAVAPAPPPRRVATPWRREVVLIAMLVLLAVLVVVAVVFGSPAFAGPMAET